MDEQALHLRQVGGHALQPQVQLVAACQQVVVGRVAEQVEHALQQHLVGFEQLERVLLRDARTAIEAQLRIAELLLV